MDHDEHTSPQAQLDLLHDRRAHVLARSGLPLWTLVAAGLVVTAYAVVWAYRPDLAGLGVVPVLLVLGLDQLQRRRGVGAARRDPSAWVRVPLLVLLVVLLVITARALASLEVAWPVVVLAAAAAGAAFTGGVLLDQRARRRWQDRASEGR